MEAEICRWVKKDGSAFVLRSDWTLTKRDGRDGRHRVVAEAVTFEDAKRHVDQFDGYTQHGGPAGSARKRAGNHRETQAKADFNPDTLAPHTATLPAAELARRLTRLDEHQQRVRAELERIGQLPRGFDEKPSPDPYPHASNGNGDGSHAPATVPGFPWLNGSIKERPMGEANETRAVKSFNQVVRELGPGCTFEQFEQAVKPRRVNKTQFGMAVWQVFKNPKRKEAGETPEKASEFMPAPVAVAVAEPLPSPDVEPEPIANAAPPAVKARPVAAVPVAPDVRAVVERAIRSVGIAVLRQALDEIEAGQR